MTEEVYKEIEELSNLSNYLNEQISKVKDDYILKFLKKQYLDIKYNLDQKILVFLCTASLESLKENLYS
jgi:DNA-binding MltR family transcriptional regulator